MFNRSLEKEDQVVYERNKRLDVIIEEGIGYRNLCDTNSGPLPKETEVLRAAAEDESLLDPAQRRKLNSYNRVVRCLIKNVFAIVIGLFVLNGALTAFLWMYMVVLYIRWYIAPLTVIPTPSVSDVFFCIASLVIFAMISVVFFLLSIAIFLVFSDFLTKLCGKCLQIVEDKKQE